MVHADVLAVVKHTAELSTITTRATNKEVKKRDLDLVDQSQVQIRLTIWGQEVRTNLESCRAQSAHAG